MSAEFLPISEFTELVTKGTTPTSIGGGFINLGINFLKVESISDSGSFKPNKIDYINLETHEKLLKRSKLKENDILFSIAGTIGKTAIVTKTILPCNVNQALAIIRPDSKIIYPYFLLYCLQDKKRLKGIFSKLVQSVQSNLSLGELQKVEIPNYSLNYQKKISNILKKFDKKIELNQKINQNSEEMAKVFFKSWFIDFEPVKIKIKKEHTNLSKEINDLFPDSFEDSEFGKIPKGWNYESLDNIADFMNGIALQKYPKIMNEKKYPVLKISQLREGSIKSQNTFSSKIPEKYIINNGDYIFSWSGSLLAKFWMGGEAALNQHLFKVTSKNYPSWFFAGWIEFHMKEFIEIAKSKATTMGHIKREHLNFVMTCVPSNLLINECGKIIEPLRERANSCLIENNYLSQIKDFLLPKLISGEIKIVDAEKFIEELDI